MCHENGCLESATVSFPAVAAIVFGTRKKEKKRLTAYASPHKIQKKKGI